MTLDRLNNLPQEVTSGMRGHNESHEIIHAALKELSGIKGGSKPAGFDVNYEALRVDSQELTVSYPDSSAPAGKKKVVLTETTEGPGVLRNIWYAFADFNADNDRIDYFSERGGKINIYIDDEDNPSISMYVSDFFMRGLYGTEFHNEMFGTSEADAVKSGAYRNVFIPFSKYLKVEFENLSPAVHAPLYLTSTYSVGEVVDDRFQNYDVIGGQDSSVEPFAPVVIEDSNGPGMLESFYLSGVTPTPGDFSWLEGNIEIYIDGSDTPVLSSPGSEDFFYGSWYEVPVGGLPAGRAGISAYTDGSAAAFYRVFAKSPIKYEDSIRIVYYTGQRGQNVNGEGNMPSSNYDITTYAGVYNSLKRVEYVASAETDILRTNFNWTALEPNWLIDSSRTPLVFKNPGVGFVDAGDSASSDVRLSRSDLALPENYSVETTFEFDEHVDTPGDFGLIVRGDGDGYFGGAEHIQVTMIDPYTWRVRLRSGFDQVGEFVIGSGQDLIDQTFGLKITVHGDRVTGYYKLGESDWWRPVGEFISAKTGSTVGIFSWDASVTAKTFTVKGVE